MTTSPKMPCADLNELLPVLERGAKEFIKRCESAGLKVKITQTYRSTAYQDTLYAQGRTLPGSIVTNAKGGQSPHNFRYAFDICRNDGKGAYDESDIFFEKCGKIGEAMGFEWGGSWKNFVDKPHFQFSAGLTDSQIRKGAKIPDNSKMPWETEFKPEPKEDDEMIDNTTVLFNGLQVKVERILKDGTNYIKLRDLEKFGLLVSYDEAKKMPVVTK